MDEDEMDIDQQLLSKFSSMGTTDRDVLIAEFQNLLGRQLDPMGCAFFLEMTNWNLQAAIGAYYDCEMPSMNIPRMQFICDVTIGEGEAIPPNTSFLKTWRLQNNGSECWPTGCCLRYVQGDKMGAADFVLVANLMPKESGDVSVNMTSPPNPGIYQGQWRMHTSYGAPFGDIIWVIISVEHGGLLGVTQQMSQFASDFGRQNTSGASAHIEPFGPVHQEMEQEKINSNNESIPKNQDDISKLMTDVPMSTINDTLNINNKVHNRNIYTSYEHFDNSMESNHLLTRRDSPIFSNSSLSKFSDRNLRTPLSDPNTKLQEKMNIYSNFSGKLQSIAEERCRSNEINNNLDCCKIAPPSSPNSSFKFRTENEPGSPYRSPTKLEELENSFNSPNAPSPIKPQSSSGLLRHDSDVLYDRDLLRQL